jgi:hypothetical protein
MELHLLASTLRFQESIAADYYRRDFELSMHTAYAICEQSRQFMIAGARACVRQFTQHACSRW